MHIIDIGNSRVTIASEKSRVAILEASLEHKDISKITDILGSGGGEHVNKVLIISVCPRISVEILNNIKSFKKIHPCVFGQDIQVPMTVFYDHPQSLGVDRLLNAYGAKRLGQLPALVFDFGTATTVNWVNAKGEFGGGMIIPGLLTGLKSLASETEMLPDIYWDEDIPFWGRSTKDGMLSGALHGHLAMVKGIIEAAKQREGTDQIELIATGGWCHLLKDALSSFFNRVDPLWTMQSALDCYYDQQ